MALIGTLRLAQIPPSIARALDDLYASGPLQTTKAVSKVLNICDKTLRRAGDAGKIAFTLKGTSHRLHTREAVEAYFLGDYEWASINQRGRTAGQNLLIGTTISSS